MIRIQGNERILIVRLGAMGDILHALPAVESLKRSFPNVAIQWICKPHWMPLLEGHPALEAVLPFNRKGGIGEALRRLRRAKFHLAIDLQGLVQSALLARLSGAQGVAGMARAAAREPLAAIFYHQRILPQAKHIVWRHLEIMEALGVTDLSPECRLPSGTAEGSLPDTPFVLACPFAGWPGKQWPLDNYGHLADTLKKEHGMTLVLNGSERERPALEAVPGTHVHCSSIAGLIHATRRATAVLGLDSGPLHLAAALGKPGLALFGPTCPERNGPVGGKIRVLRHPSAVTTYKRQPSISLAMRALTPHVVFQELTHVLQTEGISLA